MRARDPKTLVTRPLRGPIPMPFSLARLNTQIREFLQPRPVKYTGQALYVACVAQSRQPVFYTDYGIEDAIGARFELLTFHVGLVIQALRALPATDPRREQALDTAQSLFDSFLEALDNTLREQGTGDLTVPKKMKQLGTVIYTRMKRWDDMWNASAALSDQADYAARTLFAGSAYASESDSGNDSGAEEAASAVAVSPELQARADAFAAYADQARAAIDIDAVLRGKLDWYAIPPLDGPESLQHKSA